ncbi:POK8 protein, partial [Vidua chalybeata]|nr:POK8 protein [Vidua chalybeata]
MGALQPGLPNPAMLPEGWNLLIIDLKDCFFTIDIHPNDTKRFAFTLPSLNPRNAHASFHQNAKGLRRCFDITMEKARGIVRAYPDCSHHN